MKTLDEVIKKIEACIEADGHCPACPYEVSESCGDMDADALHYLKNYLDTKEWLDLEKRNYAEAIKNCERAEAKYTQMTIDMNRNDPLTWDELKTMEGKPVWVEGDRGNMWIIVGAFPRWMPDAFADSVPNIWWKKEDLGKTWQAYKKERT